ncbi:YdcH family protein [Thalassobaculum sp. OXR-137]|uniref:YdcH family protein n=1 Tax=Thalassobaculum sp. OXR-137 TaxID=3100173 RepID=UPI0039FD0250
MRIATEGSVEDLEELKRRLAELKTEHRDLDDVIARLIEHAPFDQIQLQRLKKRKLSLKDQMSRIESQLLPDIIA